MAGGPSYVPSPNGPPTIYNYVNPRTGEHLVSLLPPGHPEMICLQEGEHIRDTQYGILGEISFSSYPVQFLRRYTQASLQPFSGFP